MNGIMLGLTGLLAIFYAIFAANHKAIFPSAALVSWCVLAYLCVDFGFFHKLFQLKPEDNAVYRAASDSPSPPASSSSYRCSCASRSGMASYACCSRCGSSRN